MAGLKVGSTDITSVYVGSTPVQAIYDGSTLVWSNNQGFELALEDTVSTAYDTTHPKTISGAAIGSPSADRQVLFVFAMGLLAARTISSVTIGGVTATNVITAVDGGRYVSAYVANVTSGTTADIVVTLSSGTTWWIPRGSVYTFYGNYTVHNTQSASSVVVTEPTTTAGDICVYATTDSGRTASSSLSNPLSTSNNTYVPIDNPTATNLCWVGVCQPSSSINSSGGFVFNSFISGLAGTDTASIAFTISPA